MEVGGQGHAVAALLPGERDPVPILQEAGWHPGWAGWVQERDPVPILQEAGWHPGWAGWVQEISPSPAFDPRTVQSLASHYTDSAIPAHG